MKEKFIINKSPKKIKTKEKKESVTLFSESGNVNKSGKKFHPQWGEPVIAGVPAKKSKIKFRPKWGKPVIAGAPELETPIPATFPSEAPVHNQNEDKIKQATVSTPILETPVPATSTSRSPVPDHHVVGPISVKGNHNKLFTGIVVTVVILLCSLAGYWSYQRQDSEKTAKEAAPQEAVIPVPAVTDKNSVQVDSKPNETKSIPQEDIRSFVNKWLAGWQSGNMKAYRSCYAPDFQSKGMNLDAWISYKSKVSEKSKNVNISIDNLQITQDEKIARAAFTQSYSSSILKDKGKKTLELKKIDGEWKIYREIM
ncbi:MAG: hypothetical protein CVU55_16285 [Deltaproteobacteria bacterium HGW-Deltaproteobacteria-13]|jgi:ketosteroid isomerase-like protein|nr:MAG: hypothetical protein CVU55_16285 [Deltaproteobacteria bacterium HGW-Deltaproteobacteria-13]